MIKDVIFYSREQTKGKQICHFANRVGRVHAPDPKSSGLLV